MKIRICISIAFLALGLTACSNKSGSSSKATPSLPSSKEEALKKLTPEHMQNFEKWQSKVLKSCNSSEAFGLSGAKSTTQGVDGIALIKSNNGSMVFKDTNENFTILADYNAISGVESSKSEESMDIDGKGYTISVEAKRDGSNCSVYLFGQKVYETVIAESFLIGAEYSSKKVDTAQASSPPPIIKNLGNNGLAEVDQHGLFSLITQILVPTERSRIFIGERLGLRPEQSAQFFKLGKNISTNSALKIYAPLSLWGNNENGNLVARVSDLKKAFDGTNQSVGLEMRLEIPQFNFLGFKNNSDNGNLKLILAVSITKESNAFIYRLDATNNYGVIPFDQAEALACAKDRAAFYINGTILDNTLTPSVDTVFGPCRTIFRTIDKISYDNNFLKSLLPSIFASAYPSVRLRYGGWDEVLSFFAKEALLQGKNIEQELDPLRRTKIIPVVSQYLEFLKDEIKKSKNMEQSKNFVYQMGLSWSFSGQQVSDSNIMQMIQSVDNSIDVFKTSSEHLLSDLADNPNSFKDQLAFALIIDSVYKNEAKASLQLSKEIDYSDFEKTLFSNIIQNRIPLSDLKDWGNKFSFIKNEMSKFPLLAPIRGDLARLTLKWQKTKEVKTSEFPEIYSALNNCIVPFADNTKQLIIDLGQSFSASKETLGFCQNITEEYKQLAVSIRDNSKIAESESWGKSFFETIFLKKPSIEQLRQWNDLWAETLEFSKREKVKVQGSSGTMAEWNRKKIIEIAVNETWSREEYLGLEAITVFAHAKNTCETYRDTSSQANCVGFNLFSKHPGMFFDPAFAGRYASIAGSFSNYLTLLSDSSWTTLRWDLARAFFTWGPIWSKCDNSIFKQKASELNAEIISISKETDTLKKWDLERQIKATINDCH